jgi:hypothetical protein
MRERFRTFLGGLPARRGYCLSCLGRLWGEPSETISGYLAELDIAGRQSECGNCQEQRETFGLSS